ncbi:sensor histidine kinase [Bacillus benzoevorans]|uniref:histidine kinase n=1 Tax=Bacillus benzoevorans TaxID=1456 RepID=A0A7X0HVU6_9BACI|nr:HAMP domain-containing sensor histidine kinase [Bacillus benzoevorans]MBB6446526.1 signal transduction histidine kinase [Bacillus benzoevorans]
MNKRAGSLARKMWLSITAAIIITILYSYLLSYFFYEKLYVENVENVMLEQGKLLSLDYESGPLTDELKDKIEWFNSKSEAEIFVVSNPKELSACFPFDMNVEALIGAGERERLLAGKTIQKVGYEERFDRKLISVIIPLLDENRLEGIIYMYMPLAKITELTKEFAYLWLTAALLFLIIALFAGSKIVQRLTGPIVKMKDAAEEVAKGNYAVRLQIDTKDEIGQLSSAFNHMAESIQKEDERKKEFLANVSHELRTPISYVKGYSDALLCNMIQEEQDKKQYLHLIHREAGRMERLVGDLLDLSRLDREEYTLVKMPLPLAQLIEDSTVKYKPVLNEKGLSFRLDLDPDIIINGDEGRIEQILQNVIDNALRYTKTGGISIALQNEGKMCVIKISDTGKGIPEGDLANIKERFYRVNKARTRMDGGTGLGLAIADKLAILHDGSLTISSRLGQGTTVEIRLPVIEDII